MIGVVLAWAWVVAVLGVFVWQFRDFAALILARLVG
jgi:hypothetical protein